MRCCPWSRSTQPWLIHYSPSGLLRELSTRLRGVLHRPQHFFRDPGYAQRQARWRTLYPLG
jgi:hypothetical protein